MGRKTWESLPGKLPDREHLVMTRKMSNGETITYEGVLELSKSRDFHYGGGGVQLFLPHTKNYRTIIHCKVEDVILLLLK